MRQDVPPYRCLPIMRQPLSAGKYPSGWQSRASRSLRQSTEKLEHRFCGIIWIHSSSTDRPIYKLPNILKTAWEAFQPLPVLKHCTAERKRVKDDPNALYHFSQVSILPSFQMKR